MMDLFKFDRNGLVVFETARKALGHGFTLLPEDDHLLAGCDDNFVGDDWIQDLRQGAMQYNVNNEQYPTAFPSFTLLPWSGQVSHETRQSRIMVDQFGWGATFAASRDEDRWDAWALEIVRINGLWIANFDSKLLRTSLYENIGTYRLGAYCRWLSVICAAAQINNPQGSIREADGNDVTVEYWNQVIAEIVCGFYPLPEDGNPDPGWKLAWRYSK